MKKISAVLFWALFGMIALFGAFGTPEASLVGAISFPVLALYVARPLTFRALMSGAGVVDVPATFTDFLKQKEIDSIDGKSAEDLAGLYNEFNNLKFSALQKAIEAKASPDDIAALKSDMLKDQAEQLKHLNETLKEHGVAIKRLAVPETVSTETFSQQVQKALKANIEKLKTSKEGGTAEAKNATFDFSVKVPGTMTFANNVSGGNIPVEDRLPGLNIVPSRPIRLLDVMAQRSTTSNVVSWVYQANKDGTTGQTAEGAAKNQIDFDLVVANETVKKTTNFIKVSTEMLDDIEWLQSEIEQELMRELLKAVELTTYSGDGTGQNHNGITNVASAFSAGSFATSVANANLVDVLVIAANQIKVAQEMGATPNYIFMHPTDVTSLKLEKVSSTDKRYVERLAMIGSTLMLDGSIPIIESTLIPVGDYLIGDFTRALSVTRSGVRIEIGLDGNDFTNNLRTVLAEWRGLTLVRNNHRSAFVAGDFATDIAAILAP